MPYARGMDNLPGDGLLDELFGAWRNLTGEDRTLHHLRGLRLAQRVLAGEVLPRELAPVRVAHALWALQRSVADVGVLFAMQTEEGALGDPLAGGEA